MAPARVPTEAEAKAAVAEVVDAIATWRDEVAATSKRNNDRVLDRIADAAETLGWPKNVVDATKSSLNQASDTQLKLIDQMTEVWRQQAQSPLSSSFSTSSLGTQPFNPMDMWLQAATAWQKVFASAWSPVDRGKYM
jgi:hypothetical protein